MQASTTDTFHQLAAWYQEPLGLAVADEVAKVLDPVLQKAYGMIGLSLGMAPPDSWWGDVHLARKYSFTPSLDIPNTALVSDLTKIPLPDESVDLVLLPHALSLSSDPKAQLVEVDRVLRHQGFVVMIERSPFGLLNWANRVGKTATIFKLRSWVNHLDYDLSLASSCFYRPAFSNRKRLARFALLEKAGEAIWPYPGGVYVVCAQKKSTTLSPIKPIWSFKGYVLGKRDVQPTV
jgi:Methyltransferase domain